MPAISLTLSYLTFFLLGLFIVILGVRFSKSDKKKIYVATNNVIKKEKKKKKNRLDDILDRNWLIVNAEKQMQRYVLTSGYKITVRQLTKARMLCVLLGLILSLVLNNVLIIVPICIMFYYIPGSLVIRKAKKRELQFESQLLDSFQMFVTDFVSTRNVQTSIYNMTKKSIEPLKSEWEYLSNSLSSGVAFDQSFITFADRTGSKWSRIFAQIMISYYNQGNDFTAQLMSLTGKMTDEKISAQENKTEISSMVTLNVVMNVAVPIIYIINKIMQPEASAAFSDTLQGRIIILCIVLSCATSLWLGKKLADW